MEIKFFNSLTNKIETFKPLKENEVSMYCCGPTVYGDAHVGNIRPAIVFDTIRRFFEYLGYDVKFVSNFTDVDDKIINKALQEGVSESVITERYIAAYKDVLSKLNIKPHYKNPRVTEYMDQIISYIDDLVKSGAAYNIDGDVFFSVPNVKDYGELSNMKVDDLVVGARIEENSKKHSPLDFALWKKTDAGIKWNSPWGEGRPGWHTECCVMIDSIFGTETIDIHGGGFDLKFPHHENEMAQAKMHDHNKLARYWIHNGFVNFGNEKMSKSLGNVVLAKDAIEKFGGNVMRLLILSAHYRAPVQFTEDTANSAKVEYEKICKAVQQLALTIQVNGGSLDNELEPHIDGFLAALADDMNTSNAFTELFAEIKNANVKLRSNPIDINYLQQGLKNILTMLDIFGICVPIKRLKSDDIALYNEYVNLKKEKRFEESDRIRKMLQEKGIY